MSANNTPAPLNSIELDVSEMVPPEPLQAIFAALLQLPPQHHLDVRHRRQPLPLYGMLEQAGYHYQTEQIGSHYQIQIWPGEQADTPALARLVARPPNCV